MGGNLAVTIRTPEGEEFRMSRWTNSFPGYVNCEKFIQKDRVHLNKYLKSWREMKGDWERNKDEPKISNGFGRMVPPYEHNMTSVYAPFPYGLKPDEYGLVVIDMRENVILTNQDYSAVGSIYGAGISISMDFDRDDSFFHDPLAVPFIHNGEEIRTAYVEDGGNAQHLIELWALGKIKAAEHATDRLEFEFNTSKQLLTILTELKDRDNEDSHSFQWSFSSFEIDMSPFTVEVFGHRDRDRGPEMLARVKELGFEITDEEEAAWAEWVAEYLEEV